MKVLFLDVDGVLNSVAFFSARPPRPNASPRNDIDSAALHRLCDTIKRAGCPVVISSSWRTGEPHLSAITNALAEHGVEVFGVTGTESYKRGLCVRGVEVQCWLDDHPEVDRYVIVDDDSDFVSHQRPWFIQTCQSVGLTDADCLNIERLFEIAAAQEPKP